MSVGRSRGSTSATRNSRSPTVWNSTLGVTAGASACEAIVATSAPRRRTRTIAPAWAIDAVLCTMASPPNAAPCTPGSFVSHVNVPSTPQRARCTSVGSVVAATYTSWPTMSMTAAHLHPHRRDRFAVDAHATRVLAVDHGEKLVAHPRRRARHELDPGRIGLAVQLGDDTVHGVDVEQRNRALIARLHHQRRTCPRRPTGIAQVLELAARPIDIDARTVEPPRSRATHLRFRCPPSGSAPVAARRHGSTGELIHHCATGDTSTARHQQALTRRAPPEPTRERCISSDATNSAEPHEIVSSSDVATARSPRSSTTRRSEPAT